MKDSELRQTFARDVEGFACLLVVHNPKDRIRIVFPWHFLENLVVTHPDFSCFYASSPMC